MLLYGPAEATALGPQILELVPVHLSLQATLCSHS